MARKKTKAVSTSDSRYGNYSPRLQREFEKLEVSPGDLIQVVQGDKTLEGNLIAQSQLGDPESVIVKLDNGYNLGIKTDEKVKITKLEGAVDLETFNIHMPKQNKKLPKISLLATGGTIASRIDYRTGGVVMAMEPEEIFASLPELFDEVQFKSVKSLFSMGSEDLTWVEWQAIAENVAEEINNGAKGVVISHGTDTMGYTAAILSFMLPDLKVPVVITGAQRSSDRGSFDGAINLIAAVRTAANADLAGVMTCMHESSEDTTCLLINGTRTRKMHTTRRNAFQPINDTGIARIDTKGKIELIKQDAPTRGKGKIEAKTDFEHNVALIKVYPGINPEIIDFYIQKGVKGIIIEGTGLGHVPTFPNDDTYNFMDAIKRAIDNDVLVGMTSQCLFGRVHPYVYRATRTGFREGIVYLEDMMAETAMLKMGWVLANSNSLEEARMLMTTNLAGEISMQSKYEEFI